MERFFSEKAILAMRETIAEAGGNEVFFLGRTDEAKRVIEVEALARGNRDAVAAIMVAASFGDVVIHNHPSGQLVPSQADLEVSSVLGNQGVGFYIIDNAVSRCYQAVAPFARREVELLSYGEVERFFAADGLLSSTLADFEHRDEQVRMSFSVAEAFNEERIAVIEAGTGTGKSLAYLLPAILWAVRNKERVVVSTNTINLQEQLIRKDLPLLQKNLDIPFRGVLVKGRGNYLCLRKLEGVKGEPSLFPDEGEKELAAIVAWSEKTREGCRGDLSFIPKDEVWEELCCEADQCGRVKCPFYTRCFFYSARREAAGADILVVNHALLMADVALRSETGYGSSAILPPFTRIIFDEGHHVEDTATSFLSAQVSRHGLLKIIGKLRHQRKADKGILPLLAARLSREIPDELDGLYIELSSLLEGKLLPQVALLADEINRTMDGVGLSLLTHLKKANSRSEQKLRVTADLYHGAFWEGTEEKLRGLSREASICLSALKEFLKASERLPEKVQEKLLGLYVDLKGIAGRLENAVANLQLFIGRDDDMCRWFEVRNSGKGMITRLCSSPMEVAETVKNVILDKFKTIVVTSATLAVGEKFDFLKKRTGISLLDRRRVTELLLLSPFDYGSQAFVGIPTDIPEPGAPGFDRTLQEYLLRALVISGGRAFVLFTSYDLLSRMFGLLAEPLKKLGINAMRQGEMNRHLLLNRFRKEESAVLFGTDSFWEGVDVKGRALELVVIARLPFRVPTEPILEARAEHIARQGGDPFMEYTVPQAVIKFKQGFGRLIRSRDDRGGVLILDSRVLNKNYGRFFLKSLPPVTITSGAGGEVFSGLEKFFSSDSRDSSGR